MEYSWNASGNFKENSRNIVGILAKTMSAKIFLIPSLNICLTFSNIWRALTKQLIRSMTKVRWCSWLLPECFTNIQNTKTLRGCSVIIPEISRLLEKIIIIFEKKKSLPLLKKFYFVWWMYLFFYQMSSTLRRTLRKTRKMFRVCVRRGARGKGGGVDNVFELWILFSVS